MKACEFVALLPKMYNTIYYFKSDNRSAQKSQRQYLWH